jgi:hypothetical protein
MTLDKKQLHKLIKRYIREISNPLDKEYDKGYIDGVVDLLGDLISFLDLEDLNEFADEMEKLQASIYDWEVDATW